MATPVSSEDRGRILQAIYQEIVPLIERHARERGFDVILNANCAFWASNFVDITSDIAALQ
jgi:Skp family chaperone for outer membrane proteins